MRLVAILLLFGTSLAGCDTTQHPGTSGVGNAGSDRVAPWPYWPARMRIHPLSRLVLEPDTDRVVVEVRLEFLDDDGHTTKGSGELRIDLHDASNQTWAGSLADWKLDLADAETNRRHFDDVTQTYLFRLETESERLPPRPVMRVAFLSANGAELDSSLEIRTK
jgi:hypothetical protein